MTIRQQKTSTTKAISSTDDGYVFSPNDIVEENEMGYVVRNGDHFHFIYKNNAQQTIATTLATNSVAHEHHEEVEEGYVFDKKDVVGETETGYIVRHGDHFHYIYKDKEGNPVTTTAHHDYESEHHDGDEHDHEGEDHDHDGDKHVHEGEHHDHEAEKHENEAEHHDHDANKHEATSDDYVSPITNEKDLIEKFPEVQKYLDYITYAYGVERNTIKLESAYKD